jgi:hypothetical protein
MASKVLRIVLIIVLFIIFFEVGLISSYTIVTAEAPNVHNLVDMQIQKVTGILSPDKVNEVLIKDPTPVNISNKKDVALHMQQISNVDGINVESMNVTTYEDKDNKNFTVSIEALGYESPKSTTGQIVISQTPSYKIVAKGLASYNDNGLMVNLDTMTISSVLKLYNSGGND